MTSTPEPTPESIPSQKEELIAKLIHLLTPMTTVFVVTVFVPEGYYWSALAPMLLSMFMVTIPWATFIVLNETPDLNMLQFGSFELSLGVLIGCHCMYTAFC